MELGSKEFMYTIYAVFIGGVLLWFVYNSSRRRDERKEKLSRALADLSEIITEEFGR